MNHLRPVTSKIESVIKKTSTYSVGPELRSPELYLHRRKAPRSLCPVTARQSCLYHGRGAEN